MTERHHCDTIGVFENNRRSLKGNNLPLPFLLRVDPKTGKVMTTVKDRVIRRFSYTSEVIVCQ